MKDNYSRDSELDLNKILEEYSNIGRDKKQNNYNNAPKNQGGAHNYNRPNNQNIRQNYSNDQNKNKLGKMPSTDKKFVVNIDESLIYSAVYIFQITRRVQELTVQLLIKEVIIKFLYITTSTELMLTAKMINLNLIKYHK